MSYPIAIDLLTTQPIDDKNGGTLQAKVALIMVKLENLKTHRSKRVDCMLDSGSNTNLFPSDVADSLRIDWQSVNPRDIYGIAGAVKAYRHKVSMTVGELGLSENFETEIDFSPEIKIPLLGMNGFFDKFESISFNPDKVILIRNIDS